MVRIRKIVAPNPGPFTLEGTNTWIVGADPALVIDPGPPDSSHLEAVARSAGRVRAVLLTHHHPDHAPGAAQLAELLGTTVLAASPGPGEERIVDGVELHAGGVALRAVATPGHTPDHVAFHDPVSGVLFTGDAVLGRGTSVIVPPEGNLAAYIGSLERLLDLRPRLVLPGHGPDVADGTAKLREYIEHRREREREVVEGLAAGSRTAEELVRGIYAGYPQEIWPAAARSVLAHLIKLESEGRVERLGGPNGDRYRLASV